MTIWQTTRFQIDLNSPKIMGIVNITPDSFSDGGTYNQNVQAALNHAEQLLNDGADILDIGGESTRPGATAITPEQEWQRVRDILAEVSRWNVPISLDTRRTSVMQAALEHGYVDIINDVQALEDQGAIALLAQQSNTGICLMHMKGQPDNMQMQAAYDDIVHDVKSYLQQRVAACTNAGIVRTRIVWDMGFGFAKHLPHNQILMQQLQKFNELPILVGISRKRMIGEITGHDIPKERVAGSVAAALFAYTRGAAILRVHDVRETADALKIWRFLADERKIGADRQSRL